MIDTGAGTLMAESLGLMLQSLRASGHLPEEVTEIYMTHLHEDHEGGLTSESKRVFPNATLFAHPKDAEFWLTSGEAKSALQQPKPGDDSHTKFMNTHYKHTSQMLTPYVDAGRFRTVATISV